MYLFKPWTSNKNSNIWFIPLSYFSQDLWIKLGVMHSLKSGFALNLTIKFMCYNFQDKEKFKVEENDVDSKYDVILNTVKVSDWLWRKKKIATINFTIGQ